MRRYLKESFIDARGLPKLGPILKGWLEVQQIYSKATKDDYAWWYRERTCIGFLSAGAWRRGAVTREEWHVQRGSKKQARNGRCDLYILRGKDEFYLEAKHMYSRATGRPERELRYINDKLDQAVADAITLPCKRYQQIGVLFVAPFYPPHKHPLDFNAHISKWLEGVASVTHSAMAWLYQPRRNICGKRSEYISPGIVLLARKVHQR